VNEGKRWILERSTDIEKRKSIYQKEKKDLKACLGANQACFFTRGNINTDG
jgi:hypothetical protein